MHEEERTNDRIFGSASSTGWRWLGRALLVAEVAVVAMMGKDWANVSTYRLYLERLEAPKHSTAVQQFEIEEHRVVPQIVTRGADRLAFSNRLGQDAEVRVEARPASQVSYSIRWRDGAVDRTLAAGTIQAATPIVGRFPTGNGVIELVSDGAVTWVDPRVVRDLDLGAYSVILGILLGGSTVCRRRLQSNSPPRARGAREQWFKAAIASASLLLAVVGAEIALRAMGDRLPNGIAAERRDLGEVMQDPRWEDSVKYGRRLRPRVDTLNEWRYGDIVRTGFIPPDVSSATLHRFRFVTDGEGFRNSVSRDRFDVAALGDSFTDAMTMAVDASWPAQLERRLRVSVQNYGTAGFGPQQELRVLKEFVAVHRPARVVLAFFAGNDIFDAERFETFERTGERTERSQGWRIKDVVSRSDTWFVASAWNAGVAKRGHPYGTTLAEAAAPVPIAPGIPVSAPLFDRGMFTVPVNGRVLRWAFMPPYLNTMNLSENQLAQRRGWTLTREAILEMQRVTRGFGGELVVMFLPFKSQVHWRLLERTISDDALRSAIQFYLAGSQRSFNLDAMRHNRLAQNRLLQRLCVEAGIPFIDTTEALEARVDLGENVYFPDESHLNELGEAIVAETLAAFLNTQARQAAR